MADNGDIDAIGCLVRACIHESLNVPLDPEMKSTDSKETTISSLPRVPPGTRKKKG